MKRLIALTLILAQLTACADYETVQQEAPQEAVVRQVAVLSGWSKGTELTGLGDAIPWDRSDRYESAEKSGTWKFYTFRNDATEARFGLFFHDDRLVSIVSDADAQHFIDCLEPFNISGQRWSVYGLGAYAPWLESRALFGDREAMAAHGTVPVYVHNTKRDQELRAKGAPTVEEVENVIGYVPILIFIWPLYLIFGEHQDKEVEQYANSLEEYEKSLQVGSSAADTGKFTPDEVQDMDGMHVKYFEIGDLSYGERGGEIVMIESPSLAVGDERLHRYNEKYAQQYETQHQRQDCEALRTRQ